MDNGAWNLMSAADSGFGCAPLVAIAHHAWVMGGSSVTLCCSSLSVFLPDSDRSGTKTRKH